MEIALEPDVPTYSGGLGILAGDTLRSAADLGTPVVAVTLAYRKGYFRQILDSAGNQFEQPQEWDPERQLPEAGPRVMVEIEGRRSQFADGSTQSRASRVKSFQFFCSIPICRRTVNSTVA